MESNEFNNKFKKLVDIMERQPRTKQGYFNQLVCIKRLARITGQENKDTLEEMKIIEEDIEVIAEHFKDVDIVPNKTKEILRIRKDEIKSLNKIREAVKIINSSLGNRIIKISDELDKLEVTAHELAQVVGCPVNKMEEAKKECEQEDTEVSFLHYAIFIFGVETSKEGKKWRYKDGLLFDLIIALMMFIMTKTKKGKEAGEKLTDYLVYEEGLNVYKKGADGILKKCYPKPKLIKN